MADYSRPDPGPSAYVTTTTAVDNNWQSNIVSNTSNLDHIAWNEPPRPRLEAIDLTAYSEAELRGFAGLLEVYLNEKYPPKPPKFNSVAEADAWMEKHYGQ